MTAPIPDFSAWYRDLRDREAYPWQKRLAQSVAQGSWPERLSLPTGAGKTSLLDVWGWAAAHAIPGTPRRLVWCVERQMVVDAAARAAEALCKKVPRLQITSLHGGKDLSDPGAADPSAPTVITATVEQLGSRLLFRSYGNSRFVAPIHAGLLGVDALIVLDEAHIVAPFAALLATIERLRGEGLGLPWRWMAVSATQTGEAFTLAPEDYSHTVLQRRLSAPKLAHLLECRADALAGSLAAQAVAMRAEGAVVVAVVCNRVRTARAVYEQLAGQGDACLITGRVRVADRQRILHEYLPRLEASSRALGERNPLYVVATQTIEVGADFDFDGLVSECASLSALLQRAGRLNRAGVLGQAPMAIVYAKPDKAAGEKDDPVYGQDLKAAWDWLKRRAGKGKAKVVDLSPQAFAAAELPEEREPDYPAFGPADLLALTQTSTKWTIDITPWLHGYQSRRAESSIIWRRDMPGETAAWPYYVARVPPLAEEILSVPAWERREWLRTLDRPVAVWDGDEAWVLEAPGEGRLPPGCVVVAPYDYGGCDGWGWSPGSRKPVDDLGDGLVRRRIHPALQPEAAEWLAAYRSEADLIGEAELLALAGIEPAGAWRLADYPGGVVVVFGAPEPERVAGLKALLGPHLHGVSELARTFTPPELTPELAEAVSRGAAWHDVGKADERFQVALGWDGTGEKLAKSSARTRDEGRAAWNLAGLPAGWRHEIASAALIAEEDELVRYLVATHHGRGHCWLPAEPDQDVWAAAGGCTWADLHSRLVERFGAWGLAYLVALVRLADWARSRFEAEGGEP